MYAVHWQTLADGVERWDSIRIRKGAKKVRLMGLSEALTIAEELMRDGASYVEVVERGVGIYRQYGTIPAVN